MVATGTKVRVRRRGGLLLRKHQPTDPPHRSWGDPKLVRPRPDVAPR